MYPDIKWASIGPNTGKTMPSWAIQLGGRAVHLRKIVLGPASKVQEGQEEKEVTRKSVLVDQIK